MRTVSRLSALLILTGWTPLLAAAEIEDPAAVEALGNSRLTLTLDLGENGARVLVEASDFYLVGGSPDSGQTVRRQLVPTRLQISISGETTATARLVPYPNGLGWFQERKMAYGWDKQLHFHADPETVDFQNLAEFLPLQISIVEHPAGPPAYEIKVDPRPGASSLPGLEKETRNASRKTVQLIHRPLEQGRPGPPQSREAEATPVEPHLQIRIGQGRPQPGRKRSRLHPPSFAFHDESPRVVQTFKGNRILFSGQSTSLSEPAAEDSVDGGFGATELRMKWHFAAGIPPDVGWLEAADRDAETWLPAYGSERKFRVRLKDPSKVEAVRFSLDEVSRHPGVAVNAPASIETRAVELRTVEELIELASGDATVSWTRQMRRFPQAAFDSQPDLTLTAERNPDLEMRTEADSPVLVAENPRKTVTAIVSVHDWAASGKIQAEVLIDGTWQYLEARGPTASSDEISLLIPRDQDGNGIADAWPASTDSDGDAFPVFEEYRGFYASGTHRRLNPNKPDLIIYDATFRLGEDLRQAAEALEKRGGAVHIVRGEELPARGMALESLEENLIPAILRLESAEHRRQAWRLIQPAPGHTIIFHRFGAIHDQSPSTEILLTRDLASALNLPPE